MPKHCCMFPREFWIRKIEQAWQERSIVWLAGVRRVGKTVPSRSLSDVEYYDCELPRVRRVFEDPEAFLRESHGKRVVLDEIHRLMNPSELLKIAADHFPDVRILATGSSTLGASAKFRDTLAGRKRNLWLTPMVLADLAAFKREDLYRRLLRGGLPQFFLAESLPERDFQEWMDAYWAKDIQELFRLERRASFQKFVELLVAQSGGIFEATRFAAPCEVTRTAISNYLKVLERPRSLRTWSVHSAHIAPRRSSPPRRCLPSTLVSSVTFAGGMSCAKRILGHCGSTLSLTRCRRISRRGKSTTGAINEGTK